MELTVTDVKIDKIFSKPVFESNKELRYWELYYYSNNRRRFKGKPLVRNRSFTKAWRNERRTKLWQKK